MGTCYSRPEFVNADTQTYSIYNEEVFTTIPIWLPKLLEEEYGQLPEVMTYDHLPDFDQDCERPITRNPTYNGKPTLTAPHFEPHNDVGKQKALQFWADNSFVLLKDVWRYQEGMGGRYGTWRNFQRAARYRAEQCQTMEHSRPDSHNTPDKCYRFCMNHKANLRDKAWRTMLQKTFYGMIEFIELILQTDTHKLPGQAPHGRVKPVIDGIHGGDIALADCGNMSCHSDNYQWPLGYNRVQTLAISIFIHSISKHAAPMKIIGLKTGVPWICTGNAGIVLVRDTAVLHAGTPNTSGEDRILPSFRIQTSLAMEFWNQQYHQPRVLSPVADGEYDVSGGRFARALLHLRQEPTRQRRICRGCTLM